MPRIALPILLLISGAGMVVWGWSFHAVPVLVEEEREYEVLVPAPVMPFGPFGPSTASDAAPASGASDNPFEPPDAGRATSGAQTAGNPFEQPQAGARGAVPPGMVSKKVNERVVLDERKPEWVLVRDVTFGGVARLENGQLKRTYSGKPPALCPT